MRRKQNNWREKQDRRTTKVESETRRCVFEQNMRTGKNRLGVAKTVKHVRTWQHGQTCTDFERAGKVSDFCV